MSEPGVRMTEEEIAEGRRLHAQRALIPLRCRVCGLYAVNVVHDPPEYRAWQIEHVYRVDYYAWAGVDYHPFEPEAERP